MNEKRNLPFPALNSCIYSRFQTSKLIKIIQTLPSWISFYDVLQVIILSK